MRRWLSLQQLSALDGLAAIAALAAVAGVVWSPKLANGLARATGSVQPVQVAVDVRHLHLDDPSGFFGDVRDEEQVSIVIRNQPAGRLRLLSIADVTRPLTHVLPDGTVISAEDTSPGRALHARFQLQAEAELTGSGLVIGGTKLKIGIPVDLEGQRYRVNGTVTGIKQP